MFSSGFFYAWLLGPSYGTEPQEEVSEKCGTKVKERITQNHCILTVGTLSGDTVQPAPLIINALIFSDSSKIMGIEFISGSDATDSFVASGANFFIACFKHTCKYIHACSVDNDIFSHLYPPAFIYHLSSRTACTYENKELVTAIDRCKNIILGLNEQCGILDSTVPLWTRASILS